MAAMNLNELFPDAPDLVVTDMTTDSRRVTKGGLFLACRGVDGHGLEYVGQAVSAGAAAVVWEPGAGIAEPKLPKRVVGMEVAGLGEQVGDIADRFFGAPSAGINVTGITGTNGKTTTAWLATDALNRLDNATAYMGTLGFGFLQDLEPSALTTPGVISVHRRLRDLADDAAQSVVMEVSSHALDQGRVDGVRIKTAAFTNLTRDHLDYHGDMDSYKQAKARLFAMDGLQTAVINVGDAFGAELAAGLDESVRLIRVAVEADADITATYQSDAGGLTVYLDGVFGSAALKSPLWGRFNVENLLVAIGILVSYGYTLIQAIGALQGCSLPPGRMQVLTAESKPAVIVDFAHTPDALSQALTTVRDHVDGRVVCVFGCGGNRDRGKRAEMGAVAAACADQIIITSDNPRDEDPQVIADAIVAGIADNTPYEIELDRAAAIAAAIQSSGENDVVLVAGKGSENYQLIGDQVNDFSDVNIVNDLLGAGA